MPDQLLYALVARGTTVLAEHSTVSGNANLVAHLILEKLPQDDSRMSYSQEQHLFHILVEHGLSFVVMADQAFGRRIPFAFLEDISTRFFQTYGDAAQRAAAYEYNADFSRVLQDRMDYFSSDRNADAINRIRGEMADVKNVMTENIEKILERGERIELLVGKTDNMQNESFAFKREARRLKRGMWWRNARMTAYILLAVLAVAYVIAAFACGPLLHCGSN